MCCLVQTGLGFNFKSIRIFWYVSVLGIESALSLNHILFFEIGYDNNLMMSIRANVFQIYNDTCIKGSYGNDLGVLNG